MKILRRSLAVSAVCLAACSSPLPPKEANSYLRDTLLAARIRHARGDEVEASILADAVLRIDRSYPGARQLRESLAPEVQELYQRHPYLGSNFSIRPRAERSLLARIFLYLPDRVFDLLDVVSFDAHLGPGVFVNVHATRAAQLGGGFRAVGGVGWHDQRSFGGLAQTESGVTVANFSTEAYAASKAGSSGVFATSDATVGLRTPTMRVYQEFRDFWAVGAAVTLAVAGAELDFHPLEAADFFLGFSTIDLLADDLASTHRLDFSLDERRLLLRVARLLRDASTMEAYYKATSPSVEKTKNGE